MSNDAKENTPLRLPGFSWWQFSKPELRRREGYWHFKHEDTAALLLLVGAYALSLIAIIFIWGMGAWPVALLFLLIAILVVQLNLNRIRQKNEEQLRRSMQAWESLHGLLPLRAPLPALTGWAASPELSLTLAEIIRLRQPQHIVEFGSGASTIVMAYALEKLDEGWISSFEHNEEFARVTRRMVAEHGVDDRVTIHHAPLNALDGLDHDGEWYDLSIVQEVLEESGGVDLLLIDGPPRELHSAARYPAFPILEAYLSDNAAVVLDDATRKGEQIALDRWLTNYPNWRVEWHRSPKGTAILYRGDA